MKITIKKVIEEGMIVHHAEGEVASTKGRGKGRHLKFGCEMLYYFEDENGDEWAIVDEDRYPTFRMKKTESQFNCPL